MNKFILITLCLFLTGCTKSSIYCSEEKMPDSLKKLAPADVSMYSCYGMPAGKICQFYLVPPQNKEIKLFCTKGE